MTTTPIVYMAYDGGIGDDTTICADTVPAVIGVDAQMVGTIASKLQHKGIAVLAYNDMDICTFHKLDGVYYTDTTPNAFKEMRKKFPDIQLGVFCGNNRHDAMVMGEGGADFIVFDDMQCVSWWAPLMEVAVVQDMTQDMQPLSTGADFILRPYAPQA